MKAIKLKVMYGSGPKGHSICNSIPTLVELLRIVISPIQFTNPRKSQNMIVSNARLGELGLP